MENLTGLQIDHIAIALRPGANVEQARVKLAQTAGANLAVTRAITAGGVMGNVVLVQAGLAIVGLIILFAAGFVILNAFAMSITARTREIGALRALGMTRRQVMSLVMLEAGLLGLMGTAAGIIVGLGLAWVVMRTMGTFEDTPFAVPVWGVMLSAMMGLGVTGVAALQPAGRASRIPPIVAVRGGDILSLSKDVSASALRQAQGARSNWYIRSGGRIGGVVLGSVVLGLAVFACWRAPAFLSRKPG